MSRLPIRPLLVVLSASALGLAACSSPSGTPSAATTTTAAPPTTTAAPTTTAPSATPTTATTATPGLNNPAIAAIPRDLRSPAGTVKTAPTVTVPSGTPPKQLESADLIVGKGAAAGPGDTVTVQYVEASHSSGKVIQSSWTGQPFQFTIGANQVIKGWDMGLVGMRVGGRRELIIPPSLGYGASSQGPSIAANDTLIFVVDLQKIG
jgi:peptidylprolyl isomerase